MKILISAIACTPYSGSEGAYGWRACRAIAEDHDLWILTSAENRKAIERAHEEGKVLPNMHFHFIGEERPYNENRMYARIQSWSRYVEFNKNILPTAEKLHREVGFDRAHLVTYTTWRVGCVLWKLPIPLIWGPISGTEVYPLGFVGILSRASVFFEAFRYLTSLKSWFSPSVRECAKRASKIPVTHGQAGDVLAKLRGNREGISLFVNVFFNEQQIAELKRPTPVPAPQGPLKIFGSGNMEGRKGVVLALEALAELKRRGVKFTYTYSNRGPELNHLIATRDRLGLQNEVSLGNTLSREEFLNTLKTSDIYLLPSLREGAGQTMMEAMLGGCVPVVADRFGPGEIVTPQCGFKVPVKSPAQVVKDLADCVEKLDKDRELIARLSVEAQKRIADNYNATAFRQRVSELYK